MIVREHISQDQVKVSTSRNYTHSVDLYSLDIDKMIFNITF